MLWMSYFLSGSYIQYISISLLNYPYVPFWKWNKDKEMWQSDSDSIPLIIYSLSNQGFEANCQRERRQLLCVIPPVVSMSCLLRNGWLESITAKFASSLLSQYVKCTVVMMQAEEQRQRWIHSWGLSLRPETKRSGASFMERLYNRFDWKKSSSGKKAPALLQS